MKRDEIITNEELQRNISAYLRALSEDKANAAPAKVFFAGARTLATSIKMDMEAARSLGIPLLKRTRDFLGTEKSDEP